MGGKPRKAPLSGLTGFDRRRPTLAQWIVKFPEGRASDELEPHEMLAIADDFHLVAERYARDAYARAEPEGIDLGPVRDPEPMQIISEPTTDARFQMGLDFELGHARRWLGIPENATTAEVSAAIKRLDERQRHISAARESIRFIVKAAVSAEGASETLPLMRSVAWLLTKAGNLARFAIASKAGAFVYTEHRVNLLLRAVENVMNAGANITRRDAIRFILNATDSDQEPAKSAFDTLVEKVEDRVRKARTGFIVIGPERRVSVATLR